MFSQCESVEDKAKVLEDIVAEGITPQNFDALMLLTSASATVDLIGLQSIEVSKVRKFAQETYRAKQFRDVYSLNFV